MEESSGVRNRRIKSLEEEDRISELPDSIIQHILSLLPSTKEGIRTGILSKRWRYQWTRVPVLIFEPPGNSGQEYYRFIESALILHDCPKLKKFHLEYDHDSVEDHQFTLKVRFALRKCVEELILICCCGFGSYLLPISLFDNASLVRLEIENCYFIMTDRRVNWPALKSLKMDCRRISDHNCNCSQGIENVVCGSPLLEFFEFRGPMKDHVSIVSKSLKVMWFVDVHLPASFMISCPNIVELKVGVEDWDASIIPHLMIESVLSGCPNIHSLILAHCSGFDKLVIASKSLRMLQLQRVWYTTIKVSCPNLEKLDISNWDRITFQELNIPSSVCATLDDIYMLSDNDRELLVQLRHVNKLKIQSLFFLITTDSDLEDLLSLPLVNSKFLTLNVNGNFGLALPGISYALRLPKLETLVIELNSKLHKDRFSKDLKDFIISRFEDWNSNGSTGLTCLASRLKTVKILGMYERDDKCKLVLNFIEFLLKNARVLEKLIVSLEKSRTDFVVEVSQKLLSFPRYSQRVNIELLCSTFQINCRNC